ncbi:hypothetical protein PTSG_02059 [Salpingoeca rosetta]|uniref:ELMO domain-containing protein n=1 Tax=Salpingoeca rosetta (strain ATCC 50818 / BSB-021) TaxID=946362 RepID=F2TZR8_SALR5|nr:uncharacterized protein PTSG_02059 [Salpingoeca rosetta]EGD79092.1 hypothetical protein PTSG_02059 [Salpingoeca rosetta]|eukprot:XP_004998048.1 hypothetical protein PTSG_02059 [Salpingoeca rosetta]
MSMNHNVKIGCVLPDTPNAMPKLLEVQRGQTLQEIVHALCQHFKVDDEAHFSLRIVETNQYVTPENCNEVLKDGIVLQLAMTAQGLTAQLLRQMRSSNPSEKEQAIKNIKKETHDKTVAKEFVTQGGLPLVLEAVTMFRGAGLHSPLGYSLQALVNIVRHDLVDLRDLHKKNPTLLSEMIADTKAESGFVIHTSLQLLAAYELRVPEARRVVESMISITRIIEFIKQFDFQTQESGLALLNALIQAHAGDPAREKEAESLFRTLEERNVFRALGSRDFSQKPVPPEYAHQLYVFQKLWLRRLVQRSYAEFDWADQEAKANLQALVQCLPTLSETTDGTECSTDVDKFRLLGFQDPANPETEFREAPGMLTLDALTYWVRNSEDSYTKLAADQISRPALYTCPFVGMAKSMLAVLLQVLHAEDELTNDGVEYLPILYSSRNAFFEMFLACMQLGLRTWKEMEAKVTDKPKVLAMVRKQIQRVFELPRTSAPTNMDDFKNCMLQQSFQEMLEEQKNEILTAEEKLLQSEIVSGLYDRLTRDMTDLVCQQRLAQMVQGAWFGVVGRAKKAKASRFYVMLAPNHKTLHWGDPVDRDVASVPTLHDLPHKCDTSEIKVIYVGSDVPSIAGKKKVEDVDNAFAILASDMEEALEMVGANATTTAVWLDGIRALVGQDMQEASSLSEIRRLAKIELRLHLLNLHGLDIPTRAPEVPPLPADMNFQYTDMDDGVCA